MHHTIGLKYGPYHIREKPYRAGQRSLEVHHEHFFMQFEAGLIEPA